jgi:predicted transcriptional regulator
MSEIEQFLKKSKGLIGDSKLDLDDAQASLEVLRKVSPELVNLSIFKSLVDTQNLVDSLKQKVDGYAQKLGNYEMELKELMKKTDSFSANMQKQGESFDELYRKLSFEVERQKARNDKNNVVSELLEQYLRRHG